MERSASIQIITPGLLCHVWGPLSQAIGQRKGFKEVPVDTLRSWMTIAPFRIVQKLFLTQVRTNDDHTCTERYRQRTPPCIRQSPMLESLRFCQATMAIPLFWPTLFPGVGSWAGVSVCCFLVAPFSVFKNQIIFYYIAPDTPTSELKKKYLALPSVLMDKCLDPGLPRPFSPLNSSFWSLFMSGKYKYTKNLALFH